MRLDNRFRHGQADAGGTRTAAAFKRFEQGREQLWCDPGSAIGNSQHDLLFNQIDRKGENAAARQCLD